MPKRKIEKFPPDVFSNPNPNLLFHSKISVPRSAIYHQECRSLGGSGGTYPQEFAKDNEKPFLLSERSFFLNQKSALEASCCPKFAMLHRFLVESYCSSFDKKASISL